jgi:soluble lytic murein transglycosylase-like protein
VHSLHAPRRWARAALAVGLLGTALTGCQVSSHDGGVSRAISRFFATASPRATPMAPHTPATTAPSRPTPPPTPIAEVPPSWGAPDRVAAALSTAEATLRTPHVPATALRDAAHRQQRAYDALAVHPDWRDPVLAAVPPPLQDTVRANADAAVALRSLNGASDEVPHWRVSDPPPAADLLRWYHEAERQSDVPWAYLAAVNLVETRMGRIHADSSAGAQGPMQFLPDTWAEYGQGDVHDPHAAILAAGRFLQAAGGPGDMHGALYQYNPSELYVQAVTAYAQRMLADPQAFAAYYQWQADAATTACDVILPSGFGG